MCSLVPHHIATFVRSFMAEKVKATCIVCEIPHTDFVYDLKTKQLRNQIRTNKVW